MAITAIQRASEMLYLPYLLALLLGVTTVWVLIRLEILEYGFVSSHLHVFPGTQHSSGTQKYNKWGWLMNELIPSNCSQASLIMVYLCLASLSYLSLFT